MCDPMSATLGLSIASTVGGLFAQRQAVNAQEDYNQRQYDNSMAAYRDNIAQTNLMQSQEREQAIQQQTQNNMQAQKAMATAQVSAGEAGVSGLSVDALLSDLAGQQARYNDSVDTNYQNASMAIDNQRKNISHQAASQINQLRTPQAPDYLGAGLRIATAYNDYKNPRISGK